MAQDRVRIGISGCGDLTQRALLPHLSEPDVRQQATVEVLYDVEKSRAQTAARSFGIPHVADSFAELIAREEVDLVVIVGPMNVHAEQAAAAIRQSKHVYIQKPIGVSPEEADRVLTAAAHSRSKVLAAPVQRLCPSYGHIRRILDQGDIGPVYGVLSANHYPLMPDLNGAPRSWLRRADAGPLRDLTIYSLTAMIDLFGPVQAVQAASNRQGATADAASPPGADNWLLLLEFAGGVLGVATGSHALAGRCVPAGFLGIYGQRGSIETSQVDPATWLPTELLVQTVGTDGRPTSRRLAYPLSAVPHLAGRHAALPEAHVYADLMHLVECIREDRDPLPTLAQARHLVDVIDKAHLAARTGTRQPCQPPPSAPGRSGF